jgi:hypothetical protein
MKFGNCNKNIYTNLYTEFEFTLFGKPSLIHLYLLFTVKGKDHPITGHEAPGKGVEL